jgi:hypothetical protein
LTALLRIPVSVLVERRKARSPWGDFLWRPVAVLPGHPAVAPWTPINTAAETTLFYAGEAMIALHPAETANYRSNIASGGPLLWVVLRASASTPGYAVLAVTADPAEGEAFTDTGNDLVETVPMSTAIAAAISDFIAAHHVERPFIKRHRERADPRDGRENER